MAEITADAPVRVDLEKRSERVQAAAEQRPGLRRRYTQLHRGVRTVLTHDKTKAAGRLLTRHSAFAFGGLRIVTRRGWEARTTSRYERMMRAAEAAGNIELAADWEERGKQFRAARHQRRMDLLSAPKKIAIGAIVSAAVGIGGLLTLGIILALANHDPSLTIAPLQFAIETIRLAVAIGGALWGPALVAGPLAALAAVWNVGRNQQAAPQWALPVSQRDTGAAITPSIVVTALRDLGIGPLKTAIKAMGDSGAQMLGPIAIAGCGVEVDATLPTGASTEEVMNRRRKLAENLGRHEHEVFLSVAPAARTVRMWIADSGALDEPIPASPLVTDHGMKADYKNGRAPWGQDLRGDAALISLYQMMLLITGLSNQGKTASLRALALWLAFDVAVEFWIGDLKGIGDWRMFTGLATRLIEGPTDDHVIDVTHMVEDAVDEMERRIMAPKGEQFPALVVIVDEAQVAYGSGAVGADKRPYGGAKTTSRYFRGVKAIHDQGRVVNVTIWEGTQDPTDQNLPKRSREGNHIRASLVLGTESQGRMALGDKAIDGGAAPHKLRQGLDKGKLVLAGDGVKLPPGENSITIRTHFIDEDEAEEIAERAKARRAGVTTRSAMPTGDAVDPLADIAEVLGNAKRMRTREVLQLLAERNPGHYRSWTFPDLKQYLEAAGADIYKSHGDQVVSRNRVLDAIAEREEDDSEDDLD